MKFKGSSNIFRQIMSEISTRHKSGSARDILMQSSESEIVNFQLTIGFWEKTIMVIWIFCGTLAKDYQLCSLRPLAKYLKTVFIFVIYTFFTVSWNSLKLPYSYWLCSRCEKFRFFSVNWLVLQLIAFHVSSTIKALFFKYGVYMIIA